jgi:probable rRNA maturation factor
MFSVEIHQASGRIKLNKNKLIEICRIAAGVEKKLSGSVEVMIVSSQAMRRLNAKWRGVNHDTDVLSFAWRETSQKSIGPLGEVYLSPAKIKQQARDFSVKESEELARVLTHGLLHLVGYDHIKAQAAGKMFKRQEKIVSQICSR